MKVKTLIAAATLLLPFAAGHAALITVDTALGPATGVIDTTTNLEWLKLSATAGETPDQIFAQMAPGGLLEGFRYATVNELTCDLFAPQLGRSGCVYTGSTTNVGPVLAFMDLFGKSFDQVALFQPMFVAGQIPQVYGESWHLTRFTDAQFVDFDTQLVNLRNTQPANHWLVHEVPEPSTLSLIGLAGLALLKRKKKPQD